MQDVHFQESCAVPSTHERHFLIWSPQGDLSKWNSLGSRREAGSGIACVVSLMGNKSTCTGLESRDHLQRGIHSYLLGVNLALEIGRCHLCIFGCSNHHLQWRQKTHSQFVALSAVGGSQLVETGTSPWCSGSAAWAPALPLWAKHHSRCCRPLGGGANPALVGDSCTTP